MTLLLTDRSTEAVAVLTLNRPEKKNALSTALRDAITDRLAALATDESVRCVVFTGAGDAFSAGFDLGELEAALTDPALAATLWASSDRYHAAVLRFPLPTIAAINGVAVAGGFDLACMCDLRLAATTARFARPEGRFGPIMYGPLHDLVGSAIARDLTFTGRSFGAAEALDLRLVSRVVDGHSLLDVAVETASSIAETPRQLLTDTKAKMVRRAGVTESATLEM